MEPSASGLDSMRPSRLRVFTLKPYFVDGERPVRVHVVCCIQPEFVEMFIPQKYMPESPDVRFENAFPPWAFLTLRVMDVSRVSMVSMEPGDSILVALGRISLDSLRAPSPFLVVIV